MNKEYDARFISKEEVEQIRAKHSDKTWNPIKKVLNNSKANKEIQALVEKRKKEQAKEQRKKIFKKMLPFVGFIVAFACLLIGVLVFINLSKKIEFINIKEDYYIGDKFSFEYQVTPNIAYYEKNKIKIVLDDESYIKNNTYYKEGKANVLLYYDGKLYDEKQINIKPVISQDIEIKDVVVGIGNSIKIDPIIIPENTTNKEYTVVSNDTSIISIEGNTIYGHQLGTTSLVISSVDGGATKTINAKVIEIEPKEITADYYTYIDVGETKKLNVNFTPIETTKRELTYESSDKNVVVVNQNGEVTGIDKGGAYIVVKYNDDIQCKASIVVKYPPVQTLTLSKHSATLYIGDSIKVSCSMVPYNNRDRDNLQYYVKNAASAVIVDQYGNISAISTGTATVVATAGECEDAIEITVLERPQVQTNSSRNASTHIEGDGTKVYITQYGKRYHKDPSCPASNSISELTREQAESYGYSPCEKCWK